MLTTVLLVVDAATIYERIYDHPFNLQSSYEYGFWCNEQELSIALQIATRNELERAPTYINPFRLFDRIFTAENLKGREKNREYLNKKILQSRCKGPSTTMLAYILMLPRE